MHNIDLSVISEIKTDNKLQKLTEQRCNELYQGAINESSIHRFNTASGCFATAVEDTFKIPFDQRNIIEIECSGMLGCAYCEIDKQINYPIDVKDLVIVECSEQTEIAEVVGVGEYVRIKRQKLGIFDEPLPLVKHKATDRDLERYKKNIEDELTARRDFKLKAKKYNLEMKLVDIHYQFDRKKLFFFYTSDGRVDFRELAKDLAGTFKTRIELRQIGVRDEAKRVGGLGACGREYCCISFMNNFKRIPTQLASDQNLSVNFSKLSGPCSKLKCCLSFEVENN